jgi:hypothetical protein
MAVFCQQDEQAWRVLRQPARRVAQWRAQYHSDECVLILPNDDFGATALGAKRMLANGYYWRKADIHLFDIQCFWHEPKQRPF